MVIYRGTQWNITLNKSSWWSSLPHHLYNELIWTHDIIRYPWVQFWKFQTRDPPPKTIKTSPALLAMLVPLFRPGNHEELLKAGSTSRSPGEWWKFTRPHRPNFEKISCSKIFSTTETNALLETAVVVIVSTKKHSIAFKTTPWPCYFHATFMVPSHVFQPKTSAQSFAPIFF